MSSNWGLCQQHDKEEKMERVKRFERSTLTLARLCSTPELHPLIIHRSGVVMLNRGPHRCDEAVYRSNHFQMQHLCDDDRVFFCAQAVSGFCEHDGACTLPCRCVTASRTGLILLWKWRRALERVKGIEPSYSAWEAAALPLSYTRLCLQPSNIRLRLSSALDLLKVYKGRDNQARKCFDSFRPCA